MASAKHEMTALVIIPQRAEASQPYGSTPFPSCCGGGMSLHGKPQLVALRSLDILGSLTGLSAEGCRLVPLQMTRGNLHRERIFASLLPQYAADPKALLDVQCTSSSSLVAGPQTRREGHPRGGREAADEVKHRMKKSR